MNTNETEIVTALRAILEATYRIDSALRGIPSPKTVEDEAPKLTDVLKDGGIQCADTILNAVAALEHQLRVQVSEDSDGDLERAFRRHADGRLYSAAA